MFAVQLVGLPSSCNDADIDNPTSIHSDLSAVETGRLYLDTELANVLADVMRHFPTELDLAKWDFVRIALSSWTLTVSKNHQNFRANNVGVSTIF